MTKKEHYMALADFQTLWDDTIKPAIPSIAVTYATDNTCKDVVDEL